MSASVGRAPSPALRRTPPQAGRSIPLPARGHCEEFRQRWDDTFLFPLAVIARSPASGEEDEAIPKSVRAMDLRPPNSSEHCNCEIGSAFTLSLSRSALRRRHRRPRLSLLESAVVTL